MAWTETDGKRLKDLRNAAGLDRATFARRCTLSIAQLTELEDGGSGRFYTEQIKAHTGRTLLARLGYTEPTAPATTPGPGPAPAPAPGPADEPAPTPAPAVAPAASLPSVPVVDDLFPPSAKPPAPSPSPPIAPPAPAPSPDPDPSHGAIDPPAPGTPPSTPVPAGNGATWMSALLVVGAVAAVVFWFKPGGPSGSRPSGTASTQPAQATGGAPPAATAASQETMPSDSKPHGPLPVSPTVPPQAASKPTPKPSAPVAITATRCPPPSGAPSTYMPDRVLRPAGYVYLEANEPATVCITDSTQRQVQATVTPAEGVTVTGTPPFTVQATDWSGLRVFFQGVRVPVESQPAGNGALQLQPR